MHVESSPMSKPPSDLEAMLDAPPQDEASRDGRVQEFEANLAEAFVRSEESEEATGAEDAEAPVGQVFVEETIENDTARHESDAVTSQTNEIYIAMSRPGSLSLGDQRPPLHGEVDEGGDIGRATTLRVSIEARTAANSSVPEQNDSKAAAPAPPVEQDRPAPNRNEPARPESTRPPMNDAGVPPASPVALERAQGLETAESVRANAERGAVAPVVPEAAGTARGESRQKAPAPESNAPSRRVAAVSTPGEVTHSRESKARSDDRTQQYASRSNAETERTPYAARPADDASLARERPIVQSAPNTSPNPAPTAVQPTVELDLSAHGVQKTAMNPEPASQIGPRQPVEAIPRHVEMLATRGGGTARMRLHPAHLGEVDITISLRGDAVDVIIHAEEPAARAAVMAHREQLVEALGARELRMEGFDVNGSGREFGGENKQAAWSGADDRRGQLAQPNQMGAGQNERNETANRATRGASIHEGQGIDLRI